MSTSAALPDLTGHDDADLLIGEVARPNARDGWSYYGLTVTGCWRSSTSSKATWQ